MALAPEDLPNTTPYSAPIYATQGYATAGAAAGFGDEQRIFWLNRTSWGAILAGLVVALVVQLVLNVLGVGIGLSTLDAKVAADNPDAGNAALIATIYIVATGVVASFIGGLAAGRLSGSGKASTAAWHGLISWAVTTLVVAYLLTSVVGGAVGGTFSALGSVVGGVGKAAAAAVGNASGATEGDALTAKIKSLVNPNDQTAIQDDATAYVRASVDGDTKAADASRDKAVNDVAKAANISPDEAKTRIDALVNSTRATIADAKAKAATAAEAARKATTQAALYGAAAMMLGAIAAALGGGVGRPSRERLGRLA